MAFPKTQNEMVRAGYVFSNLDVQTGATFSMSLKEGEDGESSGEEGFG